MALGGFGPEFITRIPIKVGVPQGSILGPTLFLLYIIGIPDNITCNIAIYADDNTLYSKGDHASNLWQQLELASELEFDLQDTCCFQCWKNSTRFIWPV